MSTYSVTVRIENMPRVSLVLHDISECVDAESLEDAIVLSKDAMKKRIDAYVKELVDGIGDPVLVSVQLLDE